MNYISRALQVFTNLAQIGKILIWQNLSAEVFFEKALHPSTYGQESMEALLEYVSVTAGLIFY